MPDRFQMRPLELGDAAASLLALRRLAHGQEAELLGVPAQQFPPLQLQLRELLASTETHLGAFADGELVAALSWADDDDELGAQWITSLVVAPDWQRQGLATRLLHALSLLSGGAPLSVRLAADNAPALALYQGLGFKTLQQLPKTGGLRMLRLRRGRT